MSQPAREFLCKITELGMFAGDFVLGHVLLFVMLPVIAIPHVDKAHSVMLFWLRPRYVEFSSFLLHTLLTWYSRQIRPPIYSMKQSKLRKRRVWRYAVLYFVMLVVFLALIVGPIVASPQINSGTKNLGVPMQLLQPVGLKNNDTLNDTQTGTGAPGRAAATTSSSAATAKVRLF